MKTFSGLSEKDRKTNWVFGIVFSTFFIFSLVIALSTPQESELTSLTGTLTGFKCVVKKNSKGTSQWLEVEIEKNENQRVFTYSDRCKDKPYSFEIGMEAIAHYGTYGLNESLYKLNVNGQQIVSFQESSARKYRMPFGAIFVFGLPWAIWLFVKLIKS